MPTKPNKPCAQPGCPLAAVRGGRCALHAAEMDARRVVRLAENDRLRPSAASRGYDGKWRVVRAQYLRKHPVCAVCGARATDVHHVVPLAAGGTHEWANLRALCHAHHSAVTMRESVPRGPGNQGR